MFGSAVIVLTACGDSTTALTEEVTVSDTTTTGEVYAGSRGLVIDTREIFRQGYRPTAVAVSFPDHPRFDTELEVDPVTNLAVFVIENDSLSDEEFDAFDAGTVQSTIVVYGEDPGPGGPVLVGGPSRVPAGSIELARSAAPRTVDASNRPVRLNNSQLVERAPPVKLNGSTPYLIVPDGQDEVVSRTGTSACVDCFANEIWPYYEPTVDADTVRGEPRRRQDFYFVPVAGSPDTYTIHNIAVPSDGTFLMIDNPGGGPTIRVRALATNEDPSEFVVVPEASSRVRLQDPVSGLYVGVPASTGAWDLDAQGVHFRLLPPEADLSIENLGTAFNQPIIPPARIAFANQSTIRNCSFATVEEVVGRTETRSITRSHTTTESLETFNGAERSYTNNVNWNVDIKHEPGFKKQIFGGVTGGINFGHSHTWNETFTTTVTRGSGSTSQSDTTETIEITREREVFVPENTAVQIVDLVRTVRDVVIPWTQTLRIEGTDRATGDPLTGGELVTLLRFNLVGVIPIQVGPTFIDVTLRGETTADDFYKSETNVSNLPNACSG